MDCYSLVPIFKQLEPNNLKSIQAGFVISQIPVKADSTLLFSSNGTKFVQNGELVTVTSDFRIDIWKPGKPMFIIYNEPLEEISSANKNYATDVSQEYVRAVLLQPGDE